MLHFTYMTAHKNGKYYVGRHSTTNLADGYYGSGKWVRSIKDKSQLERKILGYYDTEDDLHIAEEMLIAEHINNHNCMNFNNRSCGFATGSLNPNTTPEARKRLSERVSGDNNPMKRGHSQESRLKISAAMKGENNPFYGKTHSNKTREILRLAQIGTKHSEETRAKYRQNHADGKYNHLNRGDNFRGKTHSAETKAKQREAQNKLPLVKCVHCGLEAKRQLIARWHNDNCKKKVII